MRPLYGRIEYATVEFEIELRVTHSLAPLTARELIEYVSRYFQVTTSKARNAVTYALLRLRARGVVEMTGRAKGARYSLKKVAA